jgi:hypothetical protein
MVEKIESASYRCEPGHSIVEIDIKEKWRPALIDRFHADRITIWWDCSTDEYDESVAIYATEFIESGNDIIDKVKSWNSLNVEAAMIYVAENIV